MSGSLASSAREPSRAADLVARIDNPSAGSPTLLLCENGSNHLLAPYETLGHSPIAREGHIARDLFVSLPASVRGFA